MTNEQLVARIQAGEDVADNMQQLCEQVKSFIHLIAWKYRDSGELEDLEQEGYLALYPAIDGYDPSSGCKFLTYAEYWIRQRMQRYLQMNGSCLRLPVHCMELVKKYEKFRQSYKRDNGCEPSDLTIEQYLGCDWEKVHEIKKNACMTKLGSLDSSITGIDGNADETLLDFVPDDVDLEGDVVDRIEAERLHEVIWGLVDSLEGQQSDVIRCKYQKGMKLDEIGKACGVDRERVRQIESKALRVLRRDENSRKLRPFLPEAEEIYSRALHGSLEGFKRTWTSSTERIALEL